MIGFEGAAAVRREEVPVSVPELQAAPTYQEPEAASFRLEAAPTYQDPAPISDLKVPEPAADPSGGVEGLGDSGFPYTYPGRPEAAVPVAGPASEALPEPAPVGPAEANPEVARLPEMQAAIGELRGRLATIAGSKGRQMAGDFLDKVQARWEDTRNRSELVRGFRWLSRQPGEITARLDTAKDRASRAVEAATSAWNAESRVGEWVDRAATREELDRFLATARAMAVGRMEAPAAASREAEPVSADGTAGPKAEAVPAGEAGATPEASMLRATGYLRDIQVRANLESWYKAAEAAGIGTDFIRKALADRYGDTRVADDMVRLHADPVLREKVEAIEGLDGLGDDAKEVAIAELLAKPASEGPGGPEAPAAEEEAEQGFKFEEVPLNLEAESHGVADPQAQAAELMREYRRLVGSGDLDDGSIRERRPDGSVASFRYGGGRELPGYLAKVQAEVYRKGMLMQLLASCAGEDQFEDFRRMLELPAVRAQFGEVSVEVPDGFTDENGARRDPRGWEPGMRLAAVTRPLAGGGIRTVLRFEKADPQDTARIASSVSVTG